MQHFSYDQVETRCFRSWLARFSRTSVDDLSPQQVDNIMGSSEEARSRFAEKQELLKEMNATLAEARRLAGSNKAGRSSSRGFVPP